MLFGDHFGVRFGSFGEPWVSNSMFCSQPRFSINPCMELVSLLTGCWFYDPRALFFGVFYDFCSFCWSNLWFIVDFWYISWFVFDFWIYLWFCFGFFVYFLMSWEKHGSKNMKFGYQNGWTCEKECWSQDRYGAKALCDDKTQKSLISAYYGLDRPGPA